MRVSLSVGTAVLVAVLAPPASAHQKRPARSVVVQMEGDRVMVLWRAELYGRPAALLHAIHDLDHNGRLDPNEQMLAAGAVATKAMAGIEIRLGDARLDVKDLEARLEGPLTGSGLTALALATSIPGAPPAAFRRTLTLMVDHGGDLGVSAQGLDDWRVVAASKGAIGPDGSLATAVTLALGQRLVLTFERVGAGSDHGDHH